jgi:hypothetical protein
VRRAQPRSLPKLREITAAAQSVSTKAELRGLIGRRALIWPGGSECRRDSRSSTGPSYPPSPRCSLNSIPICAALVKRILLFSPSTVNKPPPLKKVACASIRQFPRVPCPGRAALAALLNIEPIVTVENVARNRPLNALCGTPQVPQSPSVERWTFGPSGNVCCGSGFLDSGIPKG